MAAFLPTSILGFTTFPAFSLDVALLYERSAPGMASYVLASVGFSVAALFLGLFVIRQFV
jgi:fluoride exporter